MLRNKVIGVACNQSCVACAVSWSAILLKDNHGISEVASSTSFGIKKVSQHYNFAVS